MQRRSKGSWGYRHLSLCIQHVGVGRFYENPQDIIVYRYSNPSQSSVSTWLLKLENSEPADTEGWLVFKWCQGLAEYFLFSWKFTVFPLYSKIFINKFHSVCRTKNCFNHQQQLAFSLEKFSKLLQTKDLSRKESTLPRSWFQTSFPSAWENKFLCVKPPSL